MLTDASPVTGPVVSALEQTIQKTTPGAKVVGYVERTDLATGKSETLTAWKVGRDVQLSMVSGETVTPVTLSSADLSTARSLSLMMARSAARDLVDANADVTLISGPVTLDPPTGARLVLVESAEQMFDAVKKHIKTDIFIAVAAVADYRVEKAQTQKIKRTDANLTLQLVPNPDILAWVAALPDAPFCVGFAAESQNLQEFADVKRRKKKVPLMVANLAQSAIGADDNEITLLDDSGTRTLPRASKASLARELIDHIAKLYAQRGINEKK
jgi:phosphopantothenoylcysteine synthetase/decarboxylase